MKTFLVLVLLIGPLSQDAYAKHSRHKGESFFQYIIRILIKPSVPHDREN